MVWDVYKAVKVPIIGMGGIMNTTDAIEFFLAGSTAVQIGTANYIDPAVSIKVLEGIQEYMERQSVKSVAELTGAMKTT
jgi:dihydroorotate dehydrogenase (NAD+) catalytic subunit